MPTIHQLTPELVVKIAAGEVIERPSFAIKELIENAIDAHADEITISIQDAGLKKIQVIDNGEGMDKNDLLISWKPHTTSKIKTLDELIAIKSYGFRGEALASLAAVSKLTIQSRIKQNPIGQQIEIENSILLSQSPIGMPEGTVVIAENLFANIPARKKFLKSQQTELRHIIDVVNNFVATYPTIHFTLSHNTRILIDAPKTINIKERIEKLYGEDFSLFLPIKRTDMYIKLTGFIAKPQLHSSTNSKQYIFINKRKIIDKLISLAVKEAFGTMLESNTYPMFILFLDMPYDLVDVNVHPRKEQVSFVSPQTIFQVVKESIIEVLQENNITFQNLSWKRSGVGMTHSFAGESLKHTVLEKEKLHIEENTSITQLHNLYIIAPTKNAVVITDQHAAHERILFEKLKKEFLNQQEKGLSKLLNKPVQLTLSLTEQTIFQEYIQIFESLGFRFYSSREEQHNDSRNQFSKDSNNIMQITHIPQLFQDRDPETFIIDYLEQLSEEKPLTDIDKTSEEMLAFLACRAAVKAGDSLNEKDMKHIILELEQSPHNTTCPHGRPTQVIFPLQEINTLFKRT